MAVASYGRERGGCGCANARQPLQHFGRRNGRQQSRKDRPNGGLSSFPGRRPGKVIAAPSVPPRSRGGSQTPQIEATVVALALFAWHSTVASSLPGGRIAAARGRTRRPLGEVTNVESRTSGWCERGDSNPHGLATTRS